MTQTAKQSFKFGRIANCG